MSIGRLFVSSTCSRNLHIHTNTRSELERRKCQISNVEYKIAYSGKKTSNVLDTSVMQEQESLW